jgi:AraC-like DNA-binding protein
MGTDRGPASGAAALGNYSFRTDDLDHAVEFVTRNFADHSRVARGRGPLGYRVLAAISADCASGLSTCALPTIVRAATRTVVMHLPLEHGAEYQIGRRRLHSARDVAVLLCPGHDYTVVTPPGESLALLVEPSLLEVEIDALLARRPGNWMLKSMRLSLSPANIRMLRDLVKRHSVAVGQAQLTPGLDELRAVKNEMAAWLAKRVVDADGLMSMSASRRQVAQRVDGWIRQHLSQPITLEHLTAASRVSARSVQEACRVQWGQTPLELVAARRLEAARSALAAGAVATVTEAAVHCGFSHLGRFSISYRRAFGESPSDTLARAPNGCRSRCGRVDPTPA